MLDQISFSLWQIIVLGAVIQGAVLTTVLISNKSKTAASGIIAALVFLATIDLFLETFYTTQIAAKFPHFIGIVDAIWFTYGPLLLLYSKSLIYSNDVIKKNNLLHFLPTLILIIAYIPLVYFQDVPTKLYLEGIIENGDLNSGKLFPNFRDLVWIISCLYELVYLFITIKIITGHRKAIKKVYSNIDRINLAWLVRITLVMFFVTIISLTLGLLVYYGIVSYTYSLPIILFAFSMLIYLIGYFGLKYPIVFTQNEINIISKKPLVVENTKYAKSKLTENKLEEYHQKLVSLIEIQQLYRKSNLKLSDLSKELSIPVHDLSQLLNEELNQNFYDFINTYRVNEAKQLLVDPKFGHLSILGIAFEVGFNSKSAFYNCFKKNVGVSPSEFKKQHM